jgi:hypothetical protein
MLRDVESVVDSKVLMCGGKSSLGNDHVPGTEMRVTSNALNVIPRDHLQRRFVDENHSSQLYLHVSSLVALFLTTSRFAQPQHHIFHPACVLLCHQPIFTMATTEDLRVNNLFSLKHYVCLVTGGGTGIGLMATQVLAANGTSRSFLTFKIY